MKFDFLRKRRRKKNLKRLKNPNSQGELIPKRGNTRYYEQERPIENNVSKEELEDNINNLLTDQTGYGDISLRIDSNIHILRWEIDDSEYKYFVKVIKNKADLSTERATRLMRESGDVNPEDNLVDVVFWKKYRILLFRK